MDSPAYMTCALKLDTQTSGWHKTLTKVLKSIDGVSYSIDAEQGIAYISGKIDAGKLLKMLAKSQKYAEVCWINSGNHNASNSRMPFHGYHTYYNTGYGKHYHLDGRRENLNHWPHSHYDQPYTSQTIPFYEPSTAVYFPQAPPQKEDFNVGDAQWCNIM